VVSRENAALMQVSAWSERCLFLFGDAVLLVSRNLTTRRELVSLTAEELLVGGITSFSHLKHIFSLRPSQPTTSSRVRAAPPTSSR